MDLAFESVWFLLHIPMDVLDPLSLAGEGRCVVQQQRMRCHGGGFFSREVYKNLVFHDDDGDFHCKSLGFLLEGSKAELEVPRLKDRSEVWVVIVPSKALLCMIVLLLPFAQNFGFR